MVGPLRISCGTVNKSSRHSIFIAVLDPAEAIRPETAPLKATGKQTVHRQRGVRLKEMVPVAGRKK